MGLIRGFAGKIPRIAPNVFVAENATIIGDVEIGPGASIWYGAVLRGDVGAIRIGARTNIQDLACLHMTTDLSDTVVGEDVVVGHGAIIHGAIIGNGVLVGMGSILLDNAEIGEECIVGAGAFVPARLKVPPQSLVLGSPAKIVRALREAEIAAGRTGAKDYQALALRYRESGDA
jgi:carbonic anhydrase/acetyltransferase-like protein (isoleucine patch superfamily)